MLGAFAQRSVFAQGFDKCCIIRWAAALTLNSVYKSGFLLTLAWSERLNNDLCWSISRDSKLNCIVKRRHNKKNDMWQWLSALGAIRRAQLKRKRQWCSRFHHQCVGFRDAHHYTPDSRVPHVLLLRAFWINVSHQQAFSLAGPDERRSRKRFVQRKVTMQLTYLPFARTLGQLSRNFAVTTCNININSQCGTNVIVNELQIDKYTKKTPYLLSPL